MNVDNFLEKWCERKGINPEKIPDKIWDETVGRIEDDIEEFIQEKSQEMVKEWAFLNIEQNLSEHPEWKVTPKAESKSEVEE